MTPECIPESAQKGLLLLPNQSVSKTPESEISPEQLRTQEAVREGRQRLVEDPYAIEKRIATTSVKLPIPFTI